MVIILILELHHNETISVLYAVVQSVLAGDAITPGHVFVQRIAKTIG